MEARDFLIFFREGKWLGKNSLPIKSHKQPLKVLAMKDLLKVISMRYALEILEALERKPEGLRYTDFRMVSTPQTRTRTLKTLVDSGLIRRSTKGDKKYVLTEKGAKALRPAKSLQKLGN